VKTHTPSVLIPRRRCAARLAVLLSVLLLCIGVGADTAFAVTLPLSENFSSWTPGNTPANFPAETVPANRVLISENSTTANRLLQGSAGILPATGIQTVTYSYDSLGNPISTTTAYAGQTTSPVTNLSSRSYYQENGTWFSVSMPQVQYTENSQQQAITTGLSKQQLSNFTGSTIAYTESYSPPFTSSVAQTILSVPHANKTTQNTTLNRSTKTLVSTTTLPTSTQLAIETTTDGLFVSSVSPTHGGTTLYQYDALGRQIGQKQPRHTTIGFVTLQYKELLSRRAAKCGCYCKKIDYTFFSGPKFSSYDDKPLKK
jgi:hypothetical protein